MEESNNNLEEFLSTGFSDEMKKFNESHNDTNSEKTEQRVVSNEEVNSNENVEEKPDSEEQEEQALSTYEILAKQLQIEGIDVSQYEESIEGLVSFVKDYDSQKEKTITDNVYDYIAYEHPIIGDILEQVYNSDRPASEVIKEYYEIMTNDTLVIEMNDVDSLRSVLQQQMENSGFFDAEEIQGKLDLLQDSGELYNKAKPIIDNYNYAMTTKRQEMMAKENYRLEQLSAKSQQQGNRLQQLIESKQLEHITIPDNDVIPFMNYLNDVLDRDAEGNLFAKTYFGSLSDIETQFIRYRGGVTKIKDLVGMKANTELAKKLFTSSNRDNQKEDINSGFNSIFGHLANKQNK